MVNCAMWAGELPRPSWLIDMVNRAMWADSLYYLYPVTLTFQNPNFSPAAISQRASVASYS
jgi:hypothetical protein